MMYEKDEIILRGLFQDVSDKLESILKTQNITNALLQKIISDGEKEPKKRGFFSRR